jgi:hypothetical protein
MNSVKPIGRNFNIAFIKSTKRNKVTCLVITPKPDGKHHDLSKRVERHLGKKKAVSLAVELLTCCGAPENLVRQVKALCL